MSLQRKVLLLLLLLGWSTTFTQVGTFATFTATMGNSATFATGSLVLTDSVNGGTICSSTGVASTTDVNENTCASAFSLTTQKPGAAATSTIQVKNAGSIPASGLYLSSPGCTSTDDAGTYHGTGDICSQVQTLIWQSVPTAACRYGKGASGVVNSTARTFPLAITNTTRTFSLNVDSVAHNNLSLTTNPAYTASGLAAALNAVIGTWATAAVGLDNVIYISSNTTGSASKVTITNGSSNNALPTLGFTSGATHTGGLTTCTYDAVHTLSHLASTYDSQATGINTGILAPGTTASFSVSVSLPLAAGNDVQGRQANFGYTFTGIQ